MITSHLYPETEDEVVKFLKEHPNAQILAGGSDLTINLDSHIDTLIDLQKLPLKYIKDSGDEIAIGSMTTAYEIYISEKLPQSLRDAAFKVSDMPLLHAVTIGGNIAKLYPWCDLPPMLWALGSTIKLFEATGDYKELSADEFFEYSHKQNVSKRRSFIKEILVPKPSKNSFSQYQKFGLTEIDKGQVNLATYFSWDREGSITETRIIVSAITKSIERLNEIEKLLIGVTLSEDVINKAVEKIAGSIEIVPNYKSSKEFRAHIVRTYLKRTLFACKEKIDNFKS
jgi:CO/xanthine dehydrogenase FAD-binding subunit